MRNPNDRKHLAFIAFHSGNRLEAKLYVWAQNEANAAEKVKRIYAETYGVTLTSNELVVVDVHDIQEHDIRENMEEE